MRFDPPAKSKTRYITVPFSFTHTVHYVMAVVNYRVSVRVLALIYVLQGVKQGAEHSN